MADVNRGNRPLSPHMTVWKFRANDITSILHRITGSALTLGAVLIVWWFLAAAIGPDYFAVADFVITSWIGTLVMIGSLWALWYHTCTGIRHLIWDTGRGYDPELVARSAWIVVGTSLGLTLITLIIAI
ncbi:succinate dehydrogenase, cytochrome b556 subunit [Oceanomicrobium pacificus]|uniref:Succinate dehydrogenase cytochrome b556 subunit n=1 Tax=Oceanomicrobium pacificus TaxID=2692916 RepID=A0A6B0TKW5_9RHOB|nr:succinate dehydrogenase, cytochrome b556 subunit [Oceanomicrobium pacificus]MXU64506.1 succinate dehydrogenase, cytochrome b556 subunit [Oceanomicrobium pacificus]